MSDTCGIASAGMIGTAFAETAETASPSALTSVRTAMRMWVPLEHRGCSHRPTIVAATNSLSAQFGLLASKPRAVVVGYRRLFLCSTKLNRSLGFSLVPVHKL